MPNENDQPPRIGEQQIELLRRLCMACSVSGDEGEVRAIVLEQVRPLADAKVDALGNVLAVHPGAGSDRLRVMLAAHMDEVGFMLTRDEGEGIFRFATVGGLDERELVGKPVWVGRAHAPGVIGTKPVHLTTAEERKQTIKLDALRIDLGPGGSSKAEIGDRATFATPFAQIGKNGEGEYESLCAKALDNRLGVAILIELLLHAPPNLDLLAAFTVQEEIGGRGARVATYAFDPDAAIAIDSTPARDLPDWDGSENTRYNTCLGAGPAIYVADNSTLADPRLVRHLVSTAEELNIPYQIRQPGGGGTDAGAIHRVRQGVPSLSVSVPGRYAHTAAGLARRSDWEHTLVLLHAALSRLSPAILAGERL